MLDMFFSQPRKLFFITASVALFSLYSASSQAGIVINGTRVIYEQKEKSITVQITNQGNEPVLAQSWIDNGDANAKPQDIRVPFVLTPPINRVEPKKGQSLRISYTGQPLPQDKESVFWLNVLEIPSKPKGLAADENLMQMAFRSRIKMFYRPDGLKGKPIEAATSLSWSLSGGRVKVSNASSYHVSLVTVAIKGDSRKPADGPMLSPGASQQIDVSGAAVGKTIIYSWVNDYGAIVSTESTIK